MGRTVLISIGDFCRVPPMGRPDMLRPVTHDRGLRDENPEGEAPSQILRSRLEIVHGCGRIGHLAPSIGRELCVGVRTCNFKILRKELNDVCD